MENYQARTFTAPFLFTEGIEGPACDRAGNIYAVNYSTQGTIGIVSPQGQGSVFVELPGGSIGNGIRFSSRGEMFIADYTNHNILKVDMHTLKCSVHAHEPLMNQPNDIAITSDDIIFASDPDWGSGTGNLWRINLDGTTQLLDSNMGTTNGIEVSPDEEVLYVNESVQRRIWAYTLDKDKNIHNKRLFIEFPDYSLDGMRCDMAGNLYVTRHGKGVVAKLSPSGDILEEISLEGMQCTNLTFGGPEGKHCYVTVADQGNIQMFLVDTPGRCWGMRQKNEIR
ncbi:gluconolactonase [Paenibacillus baekrokdamisoli]|uniref:Gluconolactonase n=1 Tax=Paenibacillus baekrokdamisoli TaxID=1712516 RepID=A0A3G9J7D0_9BACL|nr:SMP-30/gluconolactonase/LRE family protein [Paenibacillus baekrokdamisoli]MBB3071783.1 sugar lactone lactonase YvrE [Paenibacillus baekrokdamisoli]BBH24235.1 gluconolactonase [Paenibacillus baekrokdamisoli]